MKFVDKRFKKNNLALKIENFFLVLISYLKNEIMIIKKVAIKSIKCS